MCRTPNPGNGIIITDGPTGFIISLNRDQVREMLSGTGSGAADAPESSNGGSGGGGGTIGGGSVATPVVGPGGTRPPDGSGTSSNGQTSGIIDSGPAAPETPVFDEAPTVTPAGRAMNCVTLYVPYHDANGVCKKMGLTVYGVMFDVE